MDNRQHDPTDVTTSELTIHYTRKTTRRGGALANLLKAIPSLLKCVFDRFRILTIVVVGLSVAHTARDTTVIQHLSTGTGGYGWVVLQGGGVAELDAQTDVDISYQPEQRVIRVKKGRATITSNWKSELPTRVFGDASLSAVVNGSLLVDQQEKDRTRFSVLSGLTQVTPFSSASNAVVCGDRDTPMRCGFLPRTLHQDEQLDAPAALQNSAHLGLLGSANDRERATGWRNGYVQLDGLTLQEAAEQFERYYNVRFDIDPALRMVLLSGRFSADPLRSDHSSRLLDPADSLAKSLRVMIPYAHVIISKGTKDEPSIISVQRNTNDSK